MAPPPSTKTLVAVTNKTQTNAFLMTSVFLVSEQTLEISRDFWKYLILLYHLKPSENEFEEVLYRPGHPDWQIKFLPIEGMLLFLTTLFVFAVAESDQEEASPRLYIYPGTANADCPEDSERYFRMHAMPISIEDIPPTKEMSIVCDTKVKKGVSISLDPAQYQYVSIMGCIGPKGQSFTRCVNHVELPRRLSSALNAILAQDYDDGITKSTAGTVLSGASLALLSMNVGASGSYSDFLGEFTNVMSEVNSYHEKTVLEVGTLKYNQDKTLGSSRVIWARRDMME